MAGSGKSIGTSALGLTLALMVLTLANQGMAAKAVKVGIHDTPFCYLDEGGQAKGFYVDVVDQVARVEGWDIEYVHASWSQLQAKFEAGEIDLLFPIARSGSKKSGYLINEEPLLSTWGRVYVDSKSEVDSLLDLRGKTVAVVKGDLFGEELLSLLDRFELKYQVEKRDNIEQVFEARRGEARRCDSDGRRHVELNA